MRKRLAANDRNKLFEYKSGRLDTVRTFYRRRPRLGNGIASADEWRKDRWMKSRFDAERDSLWKGGLAQLAVLLRKAPARVSTSLLRFDPAIARRDSRGQ